MSSSSSLVGLHADDPSTHQSSLLVNHRTGSGKTRTKIEILSDAFEWQIAKIVIVPKRFLVANFLKEIVRCSDLDAPFDIVRYEGKLYSLRNRRTPAFSMVNGARHPPG